MKVAISKPVECVLAPEEVPMRSTKLSALPVRFAKGDPLKNSYLTARYHL
jgi:hypothetical protein